MHFHQIRELIGGYQETVDIEQDEEISPPLRGLYVHTGGTLVFQLAKDSEMHTMTVRDGAQIIADFVRIGSGGSASGLKGFR